MPSKHCQNLEPCFFFQHGWGFSDTCWHGWIKELTSSYWLGNRGYWGTPNPIIEDGNRPGFVLVCHSLGFHFLSPRLLSQAGLVVIISGFAHFHGSNPTDGRFTRRHIKKMLSRVTSDPIGLLHDFYRDCNCPDWPLADRKVNQALLAQDLMLLDQNKIDTFSLQGIRSVLLLHGREDRIVRMERAEELAKNLGMHSRLTIIDGAGHGLPFTHPRLCLHLIRDYYFEHQS